MNVLNSRAKRRRIEPQVGQLLFVGIDGCELTTANRRLLRAVQPGGIVLFARNVESTPQLRQLIRSIQRECLRPPLLGIDQEGGRINRPREIVGEIATIADVKQTGDVREAEKFGYGIGRALREQLISIDFAPVLDLELFGEKADNSLRGRCWGKSAGEVVQWAGAFIDGLQRTGIAACAKHFPGLGSTTLDSHEQLPTIRKSRARLMAADVRPFRELMPRLPAVMVSHACYPSLCERKKLPATLSRRVMTELLRRQLGFDGVALTDDMEMGAIREHGSFTDAIVEAINAGADMMLVCHSAEKMFAAHDSLVRAVESGRVSPARLAETQRRIETFRKRWTGRKN